MLCLYFEDVVQSVVGHLNNFFVESYGISRRELSDSGACPLIRSCLLRLNFVENSLSQFSLRQKKAIPSLENEQQDNHVYDLFYNINAQDSNFEYMNVKNTAMQWYILLPLSEI